jgi:hypothetical protein
MVCCAIIPNDERSLMIIILNEIIENIVSAVAENDDAVRYIDVTELG